MNDWTDAIEEIKNAPAGSGVYVGCDSVRKKRNGRWTADYSTVVVVHKGPKNGCRVFCHNQTLDDHGVLKVRLLNEVSFALEAAMAVSDVIEAMKSNIDTFEVHLDINPNEKHKSSVAFKEAMGYVNGSGFTAVAKPDSWAASHVGDHWARDKFRPGSIVDEVI